jgi:hypothetical protein
MASEFPRSPHILKGALVAYESQFLGPIPNLVIFQYNPETVTRTLREQAASGNGNGGSRTPREAYQVKGPPKEKISLTVMLDAADQLETPETSPDIVLTGLHPVLASLELLLYPPSLNVITNMTLAQLGSRQITPQDAPMTLLVWGPGRAVPVHITGLTVTEKAFDQLLNPILAEVRLDMDVMTYLDLEPGTLGHGASVAHHVAKEVLARANVVGTLIRTAPLPF